MPTCQNTLTITPFTNDAASVKRSCAVVQLPPRFSACPNNLLTPASSFDAWVDARHSCKQLARYPGEPAGPGLELTHFAIESTTELLSVLSKLPDHHPKNLKLAFRVDDRIDLVLRLQHDPALFVVPWLITQYRTGADEYISLAPRVRFAQLPYRCLRHRGVLAFD